MKRIYIDDDFELKKALFSSGGYKLIDRHKVVKFKITRYTDKLYGSLDSSYVIWSYYPSGSYQINSLDEIKNENTLISFIKGSRKMDDYRISKIKSELNIL